MMSTFLEQLKSRRKELGLKQADMMLCVGISRQQYQRIETRGNPRLDTLELIAMGLKSEVLLVPEEKAMAVKALLAGESVPFSGVVREDGRQYEQAGLDSDPWQGLLGDSE